MKRTIISAALVAALLGSAPALATEIRLDGPETDLQDILNGITCNPSLPGCTLGGPSSVNVVTDQASPDSLWSIGATGASFSQIIIEIAGFASSNSMGVYDATNPLNRVNLFSGSAGAGDRALLSITADGSVWSGDPFHGTFVDSGINFAGNLFGFYLNTPAGIWYSQTGLNSDGADHMLAFAGENDWVKLPNSSVGQWNSDEYVLAWEDLGKGAWDQDYNDFVVMVESVRPVPEPGSLALLGIGLAALGWTLGRRRRAAVASR